MTKNILLVEDEVLIALSEKMELERYGYTVCHVTSGEKAVQAIRDNACPVDLVLMDIDLGAGIDGTRAAEQILRHRDIPIVFLSSHTEPEIVEKTEKITSYGYVVKDSGIVVLDTSIKMAFRLFDEKKAHKKKAEDLRENEYKYRILFENMNASFGLHEAIYDDQGNPVDFRYLEMNPMFLDNLGMTASEIRGHTAKELFPQTEQYWIDTFGEVAKTGQSVAYQNYSRELGQWFNTFIFSPQKNQFAAFFIDITEQKRAEEKLKENEQRYRALVDNSPFGIVEVEEDGTIVSINKSVAEALGTSVENLLGKNIAGFASDKVMQKRRDYCLKAITTKKIVELEDKQDGRLYQHIIVPMFYSDKPTVQIVTTDVTEQRTIQNALMESEERYKTIFDNSEIPLWEENIGKVRKRIHELKQKGVKDFNDYFDSHPEQVWEFARGIKVIDINRASLRMFGYNSKSELLGSLTNTLEHVKDTNNLLKDELVAIAEGRMSVKGEIRATTFHGEILDLLMNIFISSEKDIMIVAISDITLYKKALAEKSFLMKELNHRIKNNLAMVSSLIRLKNASLGDAADLSNLEKRVHTISLIHEKLYLSENISKIEVKEYIHEINRNVFSMSMMSVRIEENIEDLSLTTKTAIPLGLIVNEIATNTLKHGFTDRESADFIIDMRADKRKNQYVLKISNNGKPIPEEITLENPNTLGMQLISAFVNQLEGTIELQKKPHPVFTIRFPMEDTCPG